MDDEENQYELERQRIIEENKRLLGDLGLGANSSTRVLFTQPKPSSSSSTSAPRKRREKPTKIENEGPRRRSGRLAGIEAPPEVVAAKIEEEEKEREALRVINRKTRDQVMKVNNMVEETDEKLIPQLERYLAQVAETPSPRQFPETSTSSTDAYADSDTLPAEVQRLKSAFKDMVLAANAKVTSERVYSMVVHPEKTKTLVFVGDKNGQLGIWDALGSLPERDENDDDTGANQPEQEDDGEGRTWRIQAHSRNSITCMKVDPVNGSSLFTASYDCSLRKLDFATLKSQELFAFNDDDTLITHFDLTPTGQDAWISDKNGGISHVDFREGGKSRGGVGAGERRRWVVMDEGRAAKLGGISVNPLMPHLICTAGNDQNVRIWDVRHLSKIHPTSAEMLSPPENHDIKPVITSEINGDTLKNKIETHPTSSVSYSSVHRYLESGGNKGKGLMRANYQHGKSCSAAYWDPWGRRIVTTSYDDKLRVWTLKPQSLLLDAPLPISHFQPSRIIPHNCQTGRWLTILRAQWSLNMDYMPHFTVGNMKRSLDVFAATGEKLVSLWADPVTAVPAVTTSHPSRVDHVLGGNTSGRVQLWTSGEQWS